MEKHILVVLYSGGDHISILLIQTQEGSPYLKTNSRAIKIDDGIGKILNILCLEFKYRFFPEQSHKVLFRETYHIYIEDRHTSLGENKWVDIVTDMRHISKREHQNIVQLNWLKSRCIQPSDNVLMSFRSTRSL